MNLRHLRSFLTVTEHGTVSAAAQALRLTQPALSRQLQELADELGVALFERVGRRLALTAAGAELVAPGRALLAQAEALEEQARALARIDSGELRVGATPHLIAYRLPGALTRFAAMHPLVRVRLIESGGVSQWEQLRRGELHAAIGLLPADDTEFVAHRLGVITVLAVAGPGWAGAFGRHLEVRAAARLPLLLPLPGFGTRAVFDAACRLEHVTPDVVMESATMDTLLALATAGMGVAVVPATMPCDGRGLAVAPLAFRGRLVEMEMAMLWYRGRRVPRYAEAFRELLAEELRARLPRFVMPG